MKILVTGASGRLAKYVVRELGDDHELVLFSRTAPPEELAHLPWIQGDLNSFEDCQRAVAGCQVIQHLGAVPEPVDHPAIRQQRAAAGVPMPPFDMTMRTNIMGTYYLMQAAVQADVESVVMTGSQCAMGHGYRISDRPFPFQYLPLDEEHPKDVEDSYSLSKLVGIELLASFTRAYGIRTYTTMPAGICPPERRQAMARNVQPVTAWSEWLWTWVASEDVAWAHRELMEQAANLPPTDAYLIIGGDNAVLEESRDLVERFRPDLLPHCALQGHDSFVSSAKAARAFGYRARYTWREYL